MAQWILLKKGCEFCQVMAVYTLYVSHHKDSSQRSAFTETIFPTSPYSGWSP